jgi:hypothetical protein
MDDCQGIIQLAAVSRVVWGKQNPQLCRDINVQGTSNLLTVNCIICTINKLQAGVDDLPSIHLTTGHGTSLLQVIKLI